VRLLVNPRPNVAISRPVNSLNGDVLRPFAAEFVGLRRYIGHQTALPGRPTFSRHPTSLQATH
jgi:hypothetical protein